MHTHGIGAVKHLSRTCLNVPAIRVSDAGPVLIQPRIAPSGLEFHFDVPLEPPA